MLVTWQASEIRRAHKESECQERNHNSGNFEHIRPNGMCWKDTICRRSHRLQSLSDHLRCASFPICLQEMIINSRRQSYYRRAGFLLSLVLRSPSRSEFDRQARLSPSHSDSQSRLVLKQPSHVSWQLAAPGDAQLRTARVQPGKGEGLCLCAGKIILSGRCLGIGRDADGDCEGKRPQSSVSARRCPPATIIGIIIMI